MKNIILLMQVFFLFPLCAIELQDIRKLIGEYEIIKVEHFEKKMFQEYHSLSEDEILLKQSDGETVFYTVKYYAEEQDNLRVDVDENGRVDFYVGFYSHIGISENNFYFFEQENNKLSISEYDTTFSVELIDSSKIILTTISRSDIVPGNIYYYERLVYNRIE